jgi:hypothetical protein
MGKTTDMHLHIHKQWFVDEHGRRTLLRGVNFTAASKLPAIPDGATHIKTDFHDHREVSFVDHPIPLNECEEHFSRLKHWGFNCLRLLITWEALEHAGPGQYDTEFLGYIEELLTIAGEHGFYVFIDPHQDCWSRMSGGDGAPGWTFEKVGIDFTTLHEAGAAWLMQYRYNPHNLHAYPSMSWSQSRIQFGCATMFTLFFGGRDFAPLSTIDEQNVQDYLQSHYINAFKQVAVRTKEMPHVIGFDSLNEPSSGFIGLKLDGSNSNMAQSLGYAFTPITAILTGAGFPQEVPYKEVNGLGVRETRRDKINLKGISCWIEGAEDVWKKEGVFRLDDHNNPIQGDNDYFMKRNGTTVNYFRDYLSPFIRRFAEELRRINPKTIILYEGPAEATWKGTGVDLVLPDNAVNAPHWYDVATMGLHRFMDHVSYDFMNGRLLFGGRAIKKAFQRQMTTLKTIADTFSSGSPTIIGEFGLPYDIDRKRAYSIFKGNPTKAWASHVKALTWYYNALDVNLLNSCQWNYNPENRNEWGDQWNLEDFSIFSRDQQTTDWQKDINAGGRAIPGFCRPHFIAVAGTPSKMEFNPKKGTFIFEFTGDSSIDAPTVLYIPKVHYPNGYHITMSEGEIMRQEDQLVFIKIHQNGTHFVKIMKK